MKRCKFCARQGARMLDLGLDSYRARMYGCYDRQACRQRAAQIGQWIGVRVLRRRDIDGTTWTIRRAPRPGMSSSGPWYVLTCQYLQHRATSWHPSTDAAKAHRDDVVRSWEARSMRDYAGVQR